MMRRQDADPALLDRAWAGYDPRTAIPVLAIAAMASLSIWIGRWYLEELSDLADRLGGLIVFAMAWGVWPALIGIYLYRSVCFTYHLTDRALLIDFGFWHRAEEPIWLSDVVDVRSGGNSLWRWLGVGWVEVRTAERFVLLTGVRNASSFAARIGAAAASSLGEKEAKPPAAV